MSEPWCPIPVDNEPRSGPAATLWTLIFAVPENPRSVRRVAVFATSERDALNQAAWERKAGQFLIGVEKGGTLPQAWSEP